MYQCRAWAEISHPTSKGSHGGWRGEEKFMPAFLSHFSACSPASRDCLTRHNKAMFPVLGFIGQAKHGLSPRCLTVFRQGSSANKDKEGDFVSDRVAWHDQHVVTLW